MEKTIITNSQTMTVSKTEAGRRYAEEWVEEMKLKGYQVYDRHTVNVLHYEAIRTEVLEDEQIYSEG